MITGDIKNKLDRLWLTFHSNGISNPLTVIEQILCPIPPSSPSQAPVRPGHGVRTMSAGALDGAGR